MTKPTLDFGIIGTHPSIIKVRSKIINLAKSSRIVLIEGPTGTGKSLVAKAIHDQSDRKNKPFLTINCTGFSEQLLESELFGHIKGAFTDAKTDKTGLFEAAEEGTLFIDDIEDWTPVIQTKLLQALGEMKIKKVGDTKVIKINARIIVATNVSLKTLVKEGKFRQDLYYRLNIGFIQIPTLNERNTDIPELTKHLLKKHNINKQITPEAMKVLKDYDYKGNIRELENIIQKLDELPNDSIKEQDILNAITEIKLPTQDEIQMETTLKLCHNIGFQPFVELIVQEAKKKFDGNQAKAAEYIRMKKSTFNNKVHNLKDN